MGKCGGPDLCMKMPRAKQGKVVSGEPSCTAGLLLLFQAVSLSKRVSLREQW